MKNILNKFFSKTVKNQKIEEFSETDPLPRNINHPFLKSIIQCRKHRSTLAIKNNNDRLRFHFCRFSVDVFFLKKNVSRRLKQNTDISLDYI